MDVNATKEKKLTNIRAGERRRAGAARCPPRQLSLEQALEFVREDECVEVTPDAVRLRKVELTIVGRTKLKRSSPSAPTG